MKKLLLSIIAIVAGFNCASADEATYLLSQVNDTVYAITATASEAEAFVTAVGESATFGGSESAWYIYLPTDVVVLDNDYLKIVSVAKSDNICYIANNGYHISDIQADFSYVTAFLNIGSNLDQHFDADTVITSVDDLSVNWQGMYKVTAKCDGVLGFYAYTGSNGRNIGIWEMPTEDEETGSWIDVVEIDGTENISGYASGEVSANREYLLISGSNKANTNIGEITFVPATVDENQGEDEEEDVATEINPGINLLTQVNDTAYAITATASEAEAFVTAVGESATFGGSESAWYIYLPTDVVVLDNDYLKIVSVAKSDNICYIANNGYHISDIQADFSYVTAFLNIGSNLDQHFDADTVITSVDDLSVNWQGMYKVTAKCDGVLGFYAYTGSNGRNIGIWEMPTEDEETGSWIDVVEIDGTENISGYASGEVSANREYLLISGSNKANTNIGEIILVPSSYTTGIKGITSIATATDNKIYSIDGRFLGTNKDNLSKGLYIMNGKKMLVK